jgi:hypothetical protein
MMIAGTIRTWGCMMRKHTPLRESESAERGRESYGKGGRVHRTDRSRQHKARVAPSPFLLRSASARPAPARPLFLSSSRIFSSLSLSNLYIPFGCSRPATLAGRNTEGNSSLERLVGGPDQAGDNEAAQEQEHVGTHFMSLYQTCS